MNEKYLMQHVSYHLHTIVKSFSNTFELINHFCARVGFDDCETGTFVMDAYASMENEDALPLILSVNEHLIYGIVPCPDILFLVGPVQFTDQRVFLHQTTELPSKLPNAKNVAYCPFDDFVSDLLLIYNLHRNTVLDQDSLLKFNCIPKGTQDAVKKHYSNLVFENEEYQKAHNPYDQEIREQSSIENGDTEALKKSWAEDYAGELGTLSHDSLRQYKNLGIVLVTLGSRSAIRGGLIPEEAFSLSDSYIQKIEDSRDISTALHIARSAEMHYTELVKSIREKNSKITKEKNPHINKCKDYIFRHLHDKISVQDIADTLCINANYLSELFHSCEGITISRYILKEKIKLVKNLLTYSRYSYIEIANYLGFTSQSYLGQQFRKETGYTLKGYRDKYGVKEFQ